MRALEDGGGIFLFAAIVYLATMIVEYTMSTLYHAFTNDRAKRVFKVLDHSCIYLFIAGSYTPFCLITLSADGGMWLCVFVWAVALAGVACEAFWVFRPRWISAALYLLLGWCVVWFLPPLVANLAAPGLWLLVGGGVCYTVGCVFYVLKKVRYMHSIFHLWVLAGSVRSSWPSPSILCKRRAHERAGMTAPRFSERPSARHDASHNVRTRLRPLRDVPDGRRMAFVHPDNDPPS